jgi:hypothetical protein
MAFFSQGKVLLEFTGTERIKHELTPQVRKQILKRSEPFGGNLPPHHGPAFPNSGGSFGVGGVAFCTQRAFALKAKTVISGNGCRSKGKNNRPRRYFAGHVNRKPMAGRHFYGLGNAHKENIA